jgi:hypothetical protein
MPNWKKVIVSGSDAVLNSVTTSGNVTINGDVSAASITTSGEVTTNTFSLVSTVIESNSITTVDTFATSTYDGAIYDYILKDTGVGARTGQFMVSHDNGSITFTDMSTKHLTDPVIPEITADINGGNVRVRVTSGDGYTFKSFTKKL